MVWAMAWQSEYEKLFKKLKPILGDKRIQKLWLAYQTSPNHKSRAEILGVLQIFASKYLDENYDRKVLLSVPPRDVIDGEYRLGTVIHGEREYYPFGLREKEWIQHVGIFGRSGCGKTNTVFIILWNLLKKKKPFLIFDWKRNYRDLLSLEEGKNIKVYTIGRDVSFFYFNPLIPPENTRPKTWLKKLIEIMCHAYFLVEGVAYLLQKAIDKTYADFGVYNEDTERYPTFLDVLKSLETIQVKGRSAQWMDSTLRTLGVLCFGEFSRVLNMEKSFPVGELLKENAILELDSLTNSDKTFFIEALLLWIHHYRLSERNREIFKHAVIIEEAHHILLRKKQEMTGTEAITDVILREIRELGESIILVDQHPSLISMPALGNTYTTICMNLKHKADMNTISESLLLDREQIDFLGQLEVGIAIVKLQGRFFKPFLIKIPLFPLKKGKITDEDIKKKMGGYSLENEVIRAKETINDLNKEIRGYVKEEDKDIQITNEQKEFLEDIYKYPISGVVERYHRMGINAFRGNRIKNSLLEKELIYWKGISTLRGRIKILLLTHKGKTAIGKPGEDRIFPRNTSFEHEYWKYKIAEIYRKKGYKVTLEYSIGEGKKVYIVAEKNGKRIAIEIETGKSSSIYNIQKNLEVGFNEVISIFLMKDVKDKFLMQLKELGLDKGKNIKLLDVIDLPLNGVNFLRR